MRCEGGNRGNTVTTQRDASRRGRCHGRLRLQSGRGSFSPGASNFPWGKSADQSGGCRRHFPCGKSPRGWASMIGDSRRGRGPRGVASMCSARSGLSCRKVQDGQGIRLWPKQSGGAPGRGKLSGRRPQRCHRFKVENGLLTLPLTATLPVTQARVAASKLPWELGRF